MNISYPLTFNDFSWILIKNKCENLPTLGFSAWNQIISNANSVSELQEVVTNTISQLNPQNLINI
jgi:hypothetical protein